MKRLLAILFLVFIFYIGGATLPQAISSINALVDGRGAGLSETVEKIGNDYYNMLGFDAANLHNKGAYINLNGLIARVMGQRYMNGRVKLNNGHLSEVLERHLQGQEVYTAATQLTKLCEKTEKEGKAFLLVITPIQIPKYENIMPVGYMDDANQNADDLLELLGKNNVPVLDLRDEMMNDGISITDAFFTTDHHWTPETGFWAYTKIIGCLTKSGIIDEIDPKYTDIGEFNVDVYKKWFLGSSGKRTGSYYAGVDDFSVITPKFQTDMSVEIPSKNFYKNGEFAEAAIDMAANEKDYFSANPYALYGYGDIDFIRFQNEAAPIGMKVLAFGDSFKTVPFTLLSLVFSTCDQMDFRYYEGDFGEYYSETNPDIVILLTNAGGVGGINTTYDFAGDIGDIGE